MSDRLTSLDASFLYLEQSTTPMHVGSVMVFQPPDEGFDYDRLVRLISDRIAYIPRYRQRIREVPWRVGNPVWVDDGHFDITYHVRRSALPKPGTDEQLQEFVARVQPRPLDRSRPLWEVYLVEGMRHGRFAVVTKCHQALVDGVNAVDIANVLVDVRPSPEATADDGPGAGEAPVDTWRPAREPTDLELWTAAVIDNVRRPAQVIENVRTGVEDAKAVSARVFGPLGQLAAAVARTATRPAPHNPLNVDIGETRRYVMVGTDLADFRKVRAILGAGPAGEDVTVNDVVLATIAGALRSWLLTRGEAVHGGTSVRAMVPISVHDGVDEAEGAAYGGGTASEQVSNRLIAAFVDLPVGEPSAPMRLRQIAFAMRQQTEGGHAVGAGALAGAAGFASPTLHSLGARLANAASRRMFNLVVTNVPGPQQPMYAADARLLATYPVMPLAKGQSVAIGLTSYDGGVYFGINGDRVAMPDLDVLGTCLVDALAELVESREIWKAGGGGRGR